MIYELLKNISESIGYNGNYYIERQLQLAYSAAGRMALSSLHDIQSCDENDISIQHFKSRASEVFKACLSNCSNQLENISPQKIAEEIYNIYLNSGYIYYRDNNIRQAQLTAEKTDGICFLRGVNPWEQSKMSGLGMYKEDSTGENDTIESIASMFCLQNEPIYNLADRLIKNAYWTESPSEKNMEFLSMHEISKDYWKKQPDNSISIMRTIQKPHKYFIYKYEDNKVWSWEIPTWMTDDNEYMHLCNAILKYNDRLPPIIYSSAKEEQFNKCIIINLSYPLPPAEMNFLKLYSWPVSFTGNNSYNQSGISDLKRIMKKDVFSVFKKLMERSGWIFYEGVI